MISPTDFQSAQSALLQIAKLLHSDMTPTILPTELQLPKESQGEFDDDEIIIASNTSSSVLDNISTVNSPISGAVSQVHTSEGVQVSNNDRLKTVITPMNTATITKTSSLYSSTKIQLTEK